MENKNGKTTLEKLARMVADGFNELSDKVATKGDIIRVEQRFAKVEYQVDEMHEILTRFEEGDISDAAAAIAVPVVAARPLVSFAW